LSEKEPVNQFSSQFHFRATQETEEELKLQANDLKKAVAEIENEVFIFL